jgi:hypothetical protein
VAPQDGEDAGVDDEVGPLAGKLTGRLRLPPEVDAYRQAQAAKIGFPHLPALPGDDAETAALQIPQGDFPLASHQVALAVKQGGGIVPHTPGLLQQAGHHVSLERPGGPGQLFVPQEGEIFREANEVRPLTPTLFQVAQGQGQVFPALQAGVGKGLD